MSLKNDILETLAHLKAWTATVKPDAGLLFGRLSQARVRKEPLGVTLIIGAWNFPLLLLLQPLIAAIAAGCCVLLKPSEIAASVSELLCELVPQYLDSQAIKIVTGGPQEMQHILGLKWSHIFFTGSSKIARFITAAAAKHLTPVVLELGGQGPCIVTKTADVDFAARRITFAKFNNAGQICLSVNHVYAEPEIAEQLLERMKHWNDHYLSEGTSGMTRIINEHNFDRLTHLLSRTKGKQVYTGQNDRESKFFHPTIVVNIEKDDSLMSEELFGPICPVMLCSASEAVAHINTLPNPLALYVFCQDKQFTEQIISQTLSGGVTVNNVFMHAGVPNAPFGGVGESGYGAYHGVHGIDCFSHHRTVAQPPQWLDKLMAFSYPPYTSKSLEKIPKPGAPPFKRGEAAESLQSSSSRFGGINSTLLIGGIIVVGVVALGRSTQARDLVNSLFSR